jgi:zinc and cadmium transporter
MVSFAVGALLGAAFLGILPHALDTAPAGSGHKLMGVVLAGVLVFFLLEKMVLWRHCHTDECETHSPHGTAKPAAGYLILIGDSLHNFVDGILIAAAFLADFHLGIVTALAVITHEIPQELGDFAILLHSGFSRSRALGYNVLSSLATVAGGVLAYGFLDSAQGAVPYVLAIAASSFIYIAVADLIPGLHKRVEMRSTVQQGVLIAAGVGIIAGTHFAMH